MSWSNSLPIIIGFSVLLFAAAAAIFPVTNGSTSSSVGQEQLQPASAPAIREGEGGGDTTRNGPEQQEAQQRTSPGSRAGPDESEEPQRTSPGERQTEQESLQRPGEGQQEQEQESPCPEGTVLSGKGGGGDCVSPDSEGESSSSKAAPIAISGNNVYIAWPINKTGNDEVQFRASTDGGATFTDKINLSNSTGAESHDVEIATEGDSVIVTWWERNSTSNEPVVRISTDNGTTFGPLLQLATNGTIGVKVVS